MTRLLRRLVLTLPVALVAAAALIPASARADTPKLGALYHNGPTGRYLLNGPWLFRLDDANKGLGNHFFTQKSHAGWSDTSVPNAWNAKDESDKSFLGSVGWYRKEFTLPSRTASLAWVVRFESVNYLSRVWLNGHEIGQNKGAYLPFELNLSKYLKRTGTNNLVIRVDDHRTLDDFPPSGLSAKGVPTGGWWNYGGLLREVYLRKVDRVDLQDVAFLPTAVGSGSATEKVMATAKNLSSSTQKVALSAKFGSQSISLGSVTVPAASSKSVTKTFRVPNPKLWAPDSPNLYDASVSAKVGSAQVQRYDIRTGIKTIKVVGGRLMLNGRALNARGFGLHEDDPNLGFAINNQIRDRELAEVKEGGATIVRAHYPLSPYTLEQADRLGIMVWSEIPVYSVRTAELAKPAVRADAVGQMDLSVRTNRNHPSIILWSVGNELSAAPGPAQQSYIDAAAKTARADDGTRPIGYAVAGYPAAGCRPQYRSLDVLGINDYFGWYPGPNGQIADRDILSDYLDSVHACYPDKALVMTEFGAEANRDGPVEEKGTYAFQTDFLQYHLGIYATKPWLNGAIWWALEEFRVRPGWDGGNPRPDPPLHQKAFIGFGGVGRKPGWPVLQQLYKSTQQIAPAGPAR